MFNVNLESSNEIIVDEELNEVLNSLKVDYNQFYRGIVVDNLDPENKGRIKVRIPQIYGANNTVNYFVATNNIPWANCAISPAGNDSGTFLPPNIGDTVFVTFESGRKESPIYFGGIYTVRSEDTQDKGVGSTKLYNNLFVPVGVDDLPGEVSNGTERIIYKSLKGAVIYIDDKDGNEKIQITDQSGQSIIMENLSHETLKRRGTDIGKNQQSQIVLTNSAGDSITISDGKIHLKSENIIFETDNFKQIGLSDYSDEINVADIILGKEESIITTLSVVDMKTGSEVSKETALILYKQDDNGDYIQYGEGATYTFNSSIDFYDLPTGNYKANTTINGYYDSETEFTVEESTPKTVQLFVSEITTDDEIQIVLTWNDTISDMDSHTKIYNQEGSELTEVYFGNKEYVVNDNAVCQLDVDDTDGLGPETTTIKLNNDYGYSYLFFVQRFTSGYNITDSDSVVKVYKKGVLLHQINLVDAEYTEDYAYWSVIKYDSKTDEFTVINKVVTSDSDLN